VIGENFPYHPLKGVNQMYTAEEIKININQAIFDALLLDGADPKTASEIKSRLYEAFGLEE
jgi:hypothetical protein